MKRDIPPSHSRVAASFLESHTGPFRRSQLSGLIYPLPSPRDRRKANDAADRVLAALAREGKIERYGHQHWVVIARQRKLMSGREVAESRELSEVPLTTRVPGKWVAIDLETGEVYQGTPQGWKHATANVVKEAAACLGSLRQPG